MMKELNLEAKERIYQIGFNAIKNKQYQAGIDAIKDQLEQLIAHESHANQLLIMADFIQYTRSEAAKKAPIAVIQLALKAATGIPDFYLKCAKAIFGSNILYTASNPQALLDLLEIPQNVVKKVTATPVATKRNLHPQHIVDDANFKSYQAKQYEEVAAASAVKSPDIANQQQSNKPTSIFARFVNAISRGFGLFLGFVRSLFGVKPDDTSLVSMHGASKRVEQQPVIRPSHEAATVSIKKEQDKEPKELPYNYEPLVQLTVPAQPKQKVAPQSEKPSENIVHDTKIANDAKPKNPLRKAILGKIHKTFMPSISMLRKKDQGATEHHHAKNHKDKKSAKNTSA